MNCRLVAGILTLRDAFEREGLKPPVAILLESADEGTRFKQTFDSCCLDARQPADYKAADGEQCKVAGTVVRWPWRSPVSSEHELEAFRVHEYDRGRRETATKYRGLIAEASDFLLALSSNIIPPEALRSATNLLMRKLDVAIAGESYD